MMIFAGTMPPPAEDESMAPRWNRFVTIIGIALVTCDLPPASAQQTPDPLAQLNNAVQDMVQKVDPQARSGRAGRGAGRPGPT